MRQFNYLKLANRVLSKNIVTYIIEINKFKEKQNSLQNANPTELDKFLSAKASNKIAGITTTNSRIWQLIHGKIKPQNKNEDEILSYYNILNFMHENYDTLQINCDCILYMYYNLFKFGELPNKRKVDVLNVICENYKNALKAGIINDLILIHCFVLDFLCLRPFDKGNGRISRLLNLLLLYKSKYFVGCYSSIAFFIANNVKEYNDSIQTSGQGWENEKNVPTLFIEYMLNIILSCYKDFDFKQNFAYHIDETSYNSIKSFAEEHNGAFSKKDVLMTCSNFGGRSVAERNLKRLVAEGFIKRVGIGHNTLYIRTDAS